VMPLTQDQPWIQFLQPMALYIAGATGLCHHHAWLVCWDGILQTFYPDWPQTSILLISAYWVAEITDISHCTWPSCVSY
jgi:hypothetical protein